MLLSTAMRRRGKRILLMTAAIAILLTLLAVPVFNQLRQPKYKGHTASQWIERLDPHVDFRAQHDEAAEALTHIGAPAIPTIARILDPPKQFSSLFTRINALLRDFHIAPPTLPESERQYRAARAAYFLAERADADIRALVPVLLPHVTNNNYLDSEAGRALAGAGPSGISALTNLFIHPDARVRDRAVSSLYHVRDRPGVLDAFLRVIDDPSRDVRFAAVSGLAGKSKTDSETVIPIALRFASKQDPYERWAGARLLAAYASDPRSLEKLRALRDDPDQNVKSTAERALRQMKETN